MNNEGELKQLEEVVEKLTEKVEKQAKLLEKASTCNDSTVYEELREREARKLNVVMYGMGKAEENVYGRGRYDWDVRSCANLFEALKLDLTSDSIKFCRRVGKEAPTPGP